MSKFKEIERRFDVGYDPSVYGSVGNARLQMHNDLEYLVIEFKKLTIPIVSNWVAISSTEQPEIMTDVMVKYKDGRKEVAFFDGDKRFYIEKDDRDVTETIVEWHKLP